MHHWLYPRTAGENAGLGNVVNAGWNLFPLPRFINGPISDGGLGFAITRLTIGGGTFGATGLLGNQVWELVDAIFGEDVPATDE